MTDDADDNEPLARIAVVAHARDEAVAEVERLREELKDARANLKAAERAFYRAVHEELEGLPLFSRE
jgi:hypothetical protein